MTLLETAALTAFYGDFQALFDVDIEVGEGEVIAIIGANGAGKSTLLRSIAGLHPNDAEAIRWEGQAIGAMPASQVVRLGAALVPEGRRLFPSLTVEENLRIGAYAGRPGGWDAGARSRSLSRPRRAAANAGDGALGRSAADGGDRPGAALQPAPPVVRRDQLGLAPKVIGDLYRTLMAVNRDGATLILVEQDIQQAMRIADRVYCLQEGRVTLAGPPGDLTHAAIREAYFGL